MKEIAQNLFEIKFYSLEMVKLNQRPSSKVNGDYRSEPKVVERERKREFNDDSKILATLLINILSTISTIQTRDRLVGSIGLIMVPLISMKVLIFRFFFLFKKIMIGSQLILE